MGKKFWSDVWYFLSLSDPNKCSCKLLRHPYFSKLVMIENVKIIIFLVLTLFGPGFFYCLKVQEGVFKDPLKSQKPLKVAQ